jgi:anti-sigma factor RsiW
MQTCEHELLNAYLDDELDPFTRERVAEHLRACAACARELQAIEQTHAAAEEWQPNDLTALELARLHSKIDAAASSRAGRGMGGGLAMIGLIAASILVICGTWLAALPARPNTFSQSPPAPQPWEEVATRLQVPSPNMGIDDGLDDTRLADNGFTGWMIDSLQRLPR